MLGTSSTEFETNGLVCLLFFYRFHFELYIVINVISPGTHSLQYELDV
jgi:hypothetical protein